MRKFLYISTALLAIASIWVIYDLVQFNSSRQDALTTLGSETTKTLEKDVNNLLLEVMREGDTIAKALNIQSFTKEDLELFIKRKSNELDQILGITIAYEPYAFKDDVALYAPYFDKDKQEILHIETLYNYTDPKLSTASWYVNVVQNGKAWVEPYYAKAANALVADYGIPFFNKDGSLKGVISLTISLDGFTELIHGLSLGKTGYGFVASKEGVILAHPVGAYRGIKTLEQLKKEDDRQKVKDAYTAVQNGDTGNTEFYDVVKQQETLFFYDKVPASDWRIGVLFFKNDLLGGESEVKQKYIQIAVVLSFLFFFLLAIFYNRDYLSTREIWYLGFFAGFILLSNSIMIGYLEHTAIHTAQDVTQSPPVTDINTLNSVVNAQALRAVQSKLKRKTSIPTGVYIDKLVFEDSYNVSLSGKIWQKYPTEIVDSIQPGFALPQTAPFAEAQLVEERSREVLDDYTLITYVFRTTFRLNFEYKKYPFDRRNIQLYLQPRALKDNLLFVPDLESYVYTNPSQKSGLSKKISLSGNKILESYFSYNYYTYDSNFGAPVGASNVTVPELHFNIKLKRVLITPFVTYLIPIFVTLILVYMLLYSTRKKEGVAADSGVVQAMTAFFFVLIFSHIDLRKNIETSELLYLEYFYIVTYIMILWSTYNLITYSRGSQKLFNYKENLIVKATFWPLFLLMILVITLMIFY